MSSIERVTQAAQEKFGEVLHISVKEKTYFADFYFIACKRNNAPCAERPYMTITGRMDTQGATSGQISFFWGHYDLEHGQVHAAYIAARDDAKKAGVSC